MFLYRYRSQDGVPFFVNDQLPQLLRLSMSHDDYQWNYPYHVHNDRIELAYIENGLAFYKLGSHSVTAKKGELVVIDRSTLHTVSAAPDIPTNIWVLHANGFQIDGLDPCKLLMRQNFLILSLEEDLQMVDTLIKSFKLWYEKGIDRTEYICRFALATLLSLLYEMQKDHEHLIPDCCPSFAKDVILYLNENYTQPLTLDDLSKHFHMSSSAISHEFTKQFGISPINYLINRKLCEAKWLLISSKRTINDISFSLGYKNFNHFYKLFTKRTGCTPGEYREKYFEQPDFDQVML